MEATISALLQQIASNLKLLEILKQSSLPQELLVTFLTALLSLIVAIIVALKVEDIKRAREKSKLVIGNVLITPQGDQYHFRLPITNDSQYLAKNVEVDVEKIIEENGHEKSIVPTPLDWTHKGEVRNIFPHQTAHLNILEVQQIEGEFIKVRAPRIMHLIEMVVLNKGTTTIILKYYQENGQTGEIKLKVKWKGKEKLNKEDLPEVHVFRS